MEELEAAAATFQKTRSSPERLFGLRVTERDCQAAGIRLDASRGKTGVKCVDDRHIDLQGDENQFRALCVGVLARIWEGEQRLRIFPAIQVVGQIAVFSRLPDCGIATESRDDCMCVLQNSKYHSLDDEAGRITITGCVKSGNGTVEVRASRPYPPGGAE